MCLEPFGATGLFILGRGVLLLLPMVGLVIEKEKEEKGWKTVKDRPRVCSETSHQLLGADAATLHYQKAEKEQSQAGREKKRYIRTGSMRFPELRLSNSSS